MMSDSILICDENESAREALKHILANIFPLIVLSDYAECERVLKQNLSVKLCFVGLANEKTAPRIFSAVGNLRPGLTIITVADPRSEEIAVKTVQAGATGYIIKPFHADEIHILAKKSCRKPL